MHGLAAYRIYVSLRSELMRASLYTGNNDGIEALESGMASALDQMSDALGDWLELAQELPASTPNSAQAWQY
eukprot:scaffold373315_cov18-Prasinocladus_malaysianus.AAC.1